MKKYIIRRLLQCIPVLLGISIIVFSLIKMAPGDPLLLITGFGTEQGDAMGEDLELLRERYGLNKPIYAQYFDYMKGVLRGNLGMSMKWGKPVNDLIRERMWNTFYLSLLSLITSVVIAIPIGILSATKQYSKFDYIATIFAFVGISIPNFFFALLLVRLFALDLRWLPATGMQTAANNFTGITLWLDIAKHTILPVMVLGLSGVAGFVRYTRSSMLEVIRQDYVRTARAKGLSEKIVIYKHALKNALLPIITILGFQLAGLFGGSLLVENVFSWPGMGRMSYTATTNRDYPLMMGLNLFGASLTLIGNLCADIAYALVDPRIRYS